MLMILKKETISNAMLSMKRCIYLCAVVLASSLLLLSCGQDAPQIPEPLSTPQRDETPQPNRPAEPSRTVHSEVLTLTAGESGELKAVRFVQDARSKAGYEHEISPKLDWELGSKHRLYLVLVKDGDRASMHRQIITCEVVASQSDPQRRVLHYSGSVSVPNGYTLAQGQWYAMLIYNMDLYNTNNYSSETSGEAGALVAFGRHRRMSEQPSYLGTGDHALIELEHGQVSRNIYYITGVPFISQWQPLQRRGTEQAPLIEALGLSLRPQGALLSYEVGVDVIDAMAIRRYGVYSNALSFAGYYDLDADHLYDKFASRQDGIGYPDWVEDRRDPNEFSLYYSAPQAALSTHTEQSRPFPWDLPSLSQAGFSATVSGNFPTKQMVEGGSCSPTVVFAHSAGERWRFWDTGLGAYTRRSLLFWGMPRSGVAQPETYLWAGLYSEIEEDQYRRANFSPQEHLGAEITGRINGYRRELSDLEARLLSSSLTEEQRQQLRQSLEAKRRQYQPELDQYQSMMDRYGRYQRHFLGQVSPRTQPMLVLHQTSARFGQAKSKAKVSYGRTLLTSDLLLTEVHHRRDGGYNYSAVELYNPTWHVLDLNDYALVRLGLNGDRMSYRRADGSFTDDLASCIAGGGHYPLSSIESWQMVIGQPENRRLLRVTTSDGDFAGEAWYTDLLIDEQGKRPLLPGQTFVLGANAYRSVDINSSWWYEMKILMSSLSNDRGDWLRGMAYVSGHSVLELLHGEGIALLKRQGDRWQVIDATAPIGRQQLAFSGSYNGYLDEMDKYLGSGYSQKRLEGVNFPFLPPYRTQRTRPSEWSDDWRMTFMGTNTLGSRLSDRDAAYTPRVHYVDWLRYPEYSRKRTPLDPNYAAYWRNRPRGRADQLPSGY